MSATGKSTVLAELARRGHRTVDTDDEGWSWELPTGDGRGQEQLWREDRVAALLADERDSPLFVAGCARNQGRFYDRFDAIVLLSVRVDVLLERLSARTTNDFGKDPAQRARILRDLADVEPLLRASASAELDTLQPLPEVVAAIEQLARDGR